MRTERKRGADPVQAGRRLDARIGRLCVFCGEPPDKKTREHIIPQWAIELTDTAKKSFEFTTTDGRQYSVPFDQIILPACDSCNSHFSFLEGVARTAIGGLLDRKPISSRAIHDLLDWFDKVRIGLWLFELTRGGNPLQIEPKFHIKQRIATKDRFIRITHFEHKRPALSFIGTNTYAFNFSPSVFGLAINDLLILNGSFDFAVAKTLGYPFPGNVGVYDRDPQNWSLDLKDGNKTTEPPNWRRRFISPGTYVLQPIISALSADTSKIAPWPDDAYFIDQAISPQDGLGPLFASNDLASFARSDLNGEISLLKRAPIESARALFLAQAEVLRMQAYVCSTMAYPYPGPSLAGPRRDDIARRELSGILGRMEKATPRLLGYRIDLTSLI